MNEHLKLDLDTAIPSSTCEQCGAPFEQRTGSGGKPEMRSASDVASPLIPRLPKSEGQNHE